MAICKNCGKPFIPKGGKCIYCGAELTANPISIEQHKIHLFKHSIDIVFCIDCTCSMAPVIDSIKENIIRFIDVCNESHVDWRARIVLFRDSAPDKEWLVNDKPFVSKKEELVTQLCSAVPRGVIEDETETSPILDALFYAAKDSKWRYIRFPGGPMDSDVNEFLESGGCYGFKFIVGFTDSNLRPCKSKTLEDIEIQEQKRGRSKHIHTVLSYEYNNNILLFALKSINPETGRSIFPKRLNLLRHCLLKEFNDPIEFYYHKELDFSPIYSVLSRAYS